MAFDPSGNFYEGKGTTGWCIFNIQDKNVAKAAVISASKFPTQEAYWDAHIQILQKYLDKWGTKQLVVVIEDYFLYASRAQSQINSRMETPKVIGIMQWWCYTHQLTYHIQPASLVVKRWSNKILHYKGYLKKAGRSWVLPNHKTALNDHSLDAIRHAVHYYTFQIKGEDT